MKSRWLPGIADGSLKMAFAITEPDAGSNSHMITTTARPDGDGWRITGTKYWTSGIDKVNAVLVVVRQPEPGPTGKHPLSLFVVPTDAPGVSWTPIPSAVYEPEEQFMLFFDDVAVGPDGADRRGGPGPAAGLRRAEPGADHRVLHQQRHRAATR